jgi:hypothetical protein
MTPKGPTQVTVDNFCRAETDSYFARHAKDAGGVCRFKHILGPVQVDYQPVIRMNRPEPVPATR